MTKVVIFVSMYDRKELIAKVKGAIYYLLYLGIFCGIPIYISFCNFQNERQETKSALDSQKRRSIDGFLSKNDNNLGSYIDDEIQHLFKDGTYDAEVEYHNPNTGTHSSYDLPVDIEDNMVVKIHWPAGGWLDDSHFDPAELDGDGNAEFISDRGYTYEVHIDEAPEERN